MAATVGQSVAAARRTVDLEVARDVELEPTPLAAWWALEDLWLRLRSALSVALVRKADGVELVLRGFRSLAGDELRYAALDLQRYAWASNGARGSFVQRLAYQGDDLTCLLTPERVVRHWPEGEDVACLMRAFLLRLTREPAQGNAVVSAPCLASQASCAQRPKRMGRRCAAPVGTVT